MVIRQKEETRWQCILIELMSGCLDGTQETMEPNDRGGELRRHDVQRQSPWVAT